MASDDKLQRYELQPDYREPYDKSMVSNEEGEWVKYEDAMNLDTQLKIAFAEMWLAWMNNAGPLAARPLHYDMCAAEYQSGERTPELLAEMRRVTAELEGK
jgi:hypothetical protein